MMAGDYCILIVDDQTGVRRLLCEAFIEDGYNIEQASGGAEALQKIAADTPDLVLLDIKMPGMNGLQTLRELRKTRPDLIVVMMTAYGELDMINEVKGMGVVHYIVKPFDLNEVRYLVKGLLQEQTPLKLLQEIG